VKKKKKYQIVASNETKIKILYLIKKSNKIIKINPNQALLFFIHKKNPTVKINKKNNIK
jgi:hypothetical protein